MKTVLVFIFSFFTIIFSYAQEPTKEQIKEYNYAIKKAKSQLEFYHNPVEALPYLQQISNNPIIVDNAEFELLSGTIDAAFISRLYKISSLEGARHALNGYKHLKKAYQLLNGEHLEPAGPFSIRGDKQKVFDAQNDAFSIFEKTDGLEAIGSIFYENNDYANSVEAYRLAIEAYTDPFMQKSISTKDGAPIKSWIIKKTQTEEKLQRLQLLKEVSRAKYETQLALDESSRETNLAKGKTSTISHKLIFGNADGDQESLSYRRNSLCTFFVSSNSSDIKGVQNVINDVYENYEISGKYNNHNLADRIVNLDHVVGYKIYEKKMNKKNRGSFGKILASSLAATISINGRTLSDNSADEEVNHTTIIPAKLMAYVQQNHIASKLLAKWFNASTVIHEDGSIYDMQLILERGAYNATELERLKAKETIRGEAILKDAGIELINNTYVSFTFFDFVSISSLAKRNSNAMGWNTLFKQAKASSVISSGKSGYIIKARTYLFHLIWNKEMENLFLSKYYNQPLEKLLSSDEFQLEFMGMQDDCNWFTQGVDNSFDISKNGPAARQAAIRAIDLSLYKLMEEYEDFRVKTPLIDVEKDKISAFIGSKEGVNPDSKFEVLERVFNEKKEEFSYKRVGTLKVDKDKIWENRYSIDGVETDGELFFSTNPTIDRTYFKGSIGNLAPGMLIRQTK